MRKIALFGILAVAGLLAGCVQMHSVTVIEKDGSGNASLTLSLSQVVTDNFEELQELGSSNQMGGGSDIPSFDDFDKVELEKFAKENGVKVTKFEKGVVEGRETLAVEMEFKTVAGLSRTLDMIGQESDNAEIWTILKRADGNYVLKSVPDDQPRLKSEKESAEAPEAAETDPEAAAQDAQKAMELMSKMMAAMQELDVRMEITVPGEVLDSNAPEVEGTTSIWSLNAANMMQAQNMDMEPEIVFSSKGLKIDAPPVK